MSNGWARTLGSDKMHCESSRSIFNQGIQVASLPQDFPNARRHHHDRNRIKDDDVRFFHGTGLVNVDELRLIEAKAQGDIAQHHLLFRKKLTEVLHYRGKFIRYVAGIHGVKDVGRVEGPVPACFNNFHSREITRS